MQSVRLAVRYGGLGAVAVKLTYLQLAICLAILILNALPPILLLLVGVLHSLKRLRAMLTRDG